jgi:hypothetical protein
VREVLRVKHYSARTEETYVQWIVRFLRFHRQWVPNSTPHPQPLSPSDAERVAPGRGEKENGDGSIRERWTPRRLSHS